MVPGRSPSTTPDVTAPAPAVCLRAEAPLQLREAPDLGAVGPDVGLDVGCCPLDDGQVDAEQFRAPLQRREDRPGVGRVVCFPGPHDR
jgi:hypothetical protein